MPPRRKTKTTDVPGMELDATAPEPQKLTKEQKDSFKDLKFAELPPEVQADIINKVRADDDFQKEMAELAEAKRLEEFEQSLNDPILINDKEVPPVTPMTWRWLDAINSPFAPSGNFKDLCDADLVTALNVIFRGRAAIRPFLSLPVKVRSLPEDKANELKEQVINDVIEDSYDWLDELMPNVDLQTIADTVILALRKSSPFATTKKN